MKILATAPSRISLAGGGTDIDTYSHQFGGRVISMAINLRQHVTIYTGESLWLVENSIPYGADIKLFHKICSNYAVGSMHAIRFVSSFDGMIGAGLGSSAAASVALLGALRKLKSIPLDRYEVANEAYDIEVNQLNWAGGRQDQLASAFGGLNTITFGEEVKVTPLEIPSTDRLLSSMVLIYIGNPRMSKDIQKALTMLSKRKIDILDKIQANVFLMETALKQGNIEAVGNLMHESWEYKRRLRGVSNEQIDAVYTRGREAGALGGKLLGAGGGGYFLFIVSPEKREGFIKEMGENVDFGISREGLEVRIL